MCMCVYVYIFISEPLNVGSLLNSHRGMLFSNSWRCTVLYYNVLKCTTLQESVLVILACFVILGFLPKVVFILKFLSFFLFWCCLCYLPNLPTYQMLLAFFKHNIYNFYFLRSYLLLPSLVLPSFLSKNHKWDELILHNLQLYRIECYSYPRAALIFSISTQRTFE